MNISSFPLKDGNTWRYLVQDFYSNTADTLIVSICNHKTINGQECWFCSLMEDAVIVDSGYFTKNDQTLSYKGLNPHGYSYFGNFVLSFPLAVNSSWPGFYSVDTVRLISVDTSEKILNNTYKNIFYAKRAFFLNNGYSLVQSLEICSNIGIVQQNLDVFYSNGIPQKQDFELIDYKLN